MTRTRRFLGGVTFGYTNLVLVTLVGLWLTPFLLGRLGQRDLGLWLLATQLVGYLALLDLGVVALLPRETAFASGLRGDSRDAVAATVGRFRRLMRWQLPLVALAAMLAWLALPEEWAPLRTPLVGVLVVFVATFPFRAYHAVLQGLQDHAFIGRIQLVAWAAGTTATIVLVLAGLGLVSLVIGWAMTQAASALGCRWRLRRRFPDLWQPTPPRLTWPAAREMYGRSLWLSLAQVGHVFLTGTDVLIVGRMLGVGAVVPYACTTKLVTVLANHPQLLMQTAAPALSELRAAGERERLVAVCSALGRAMLVLSGGVACLVIAANHAFVAWWVGPSLFAGWPVTLAIVSAMLVRHFNDTAVYALYAFRHERAQSLTAVADGAVTLVASAVLVHQYGLVGAPLGSLLGCATVSLPSNLRRLARELDVSWTTPLTNIGPWAGRFAVAAVAAAGLAWLAGPGSFWVLGGVAATTAVVYAAVMWPLAAEPPLGPYVRAALGPLAAWLPGSRAAATTPLP